MCCVNIIFNLATMQKSCDVGNILKNIGKTCLYKMVQRRNDPIKIFYRSISVKPNSAFSGAKELTSMNPAKIKLIPDQDMECFRSHFPTVVEELTMNNLVTNADEVRERLRKILEYNVPNGKQIRAAMFIATYRFIENKENFTEETLRQVHTLAWCIEMISSYILMLDDIVDNSEKRRGQKSWFKDEDIGLNAINDATVLQMSIFKLLQKHFYSHKHYKEMIHVFLEINLKTFVGQIMDSQRFNFQTSTKKQYEMTTDNKTGYYTFYLPLMLAMYFTNRLDLNFNKSFNVLLTLARFFQYQNDFMDVYGESYSGKLGTDIQEAKCSWMILTALDKATTKQRALLEEHYGKWNSDSVKKVKEIYDELDLKNSFNLEIKNTYIKATSDISQIDNQLSRQLLMKLVKAFLGSDHN